MAPTPQASGHEPFKKPSRQARHQVLSRVRDWKWPAMGEEEQPLTGDLTLATIERATLRDLGVRFVAAHDATVFLPVAGLPNPSPAGHSLPLDSPSSHRYGVSGMCSMSQ